MNIRELDSEQVVELYDCFSTALIKHKQGIYDTVIISQVNSRYLVMTKNDSSISSVESRARVNIMKYVFFGTLFKYFDIESEVGNYDFRATLVSENVLVFRFSYEMVKTKVIYDRQSNTLTLIKGDKAVIFPVRDFIKPILAEIIVTEILNEHF